MKNLLKMIAIGTLAINITTPLINQSVVDNKAIQKNEQQLKFYFNQNHRAEEMISIYPRGTDDKMAMYMITHDISNIQISSYKWFKPLDPNNESYTKTSWGTSAYWGQNFRDIGTILMDDILFPGVKVSFTEHDIWTYSKYQLLEVADTSGWARIKSWHKFGLSFFRDNGKTYLQFFFLHRIHFFATLSGGAMWTNYGQGFALIK